jgi:LuxR family transcriptional activator of bioluminescence operon
MEVITLYSLISELEASETQEDLKSVCLKFCQLVNIPFYLMGVISHNSLYAPNINILTNYSEQWMKNYLKQNKKKTDPVVAYMISKNAPVRWDQLITLDEFKTSEQQLLMQQASEHGLVNGLSVPVHSVSGYIGVLSLAIDIEGNDGCKLLEEALPYAHIFAMHLFEQYLTILAKEYLIETEVKLTAREEECLFWACEGKTSWEMSQILNIKERTVEFHLNNSVKKLGATNRQHAVAIATKKGVIQPNM